MDLEAHDLYRPSDFLGFSLLFGYTRFINETGIPAAGGDAYPSEDMSEADLTVRGQVYPVGRRVVSPYAGVGIGRFRLIQDFRRYTGTCASLPGYSCRTYVLDDETAAAGMFWDVHLGVVIGLSQGLAFVLEGRRETSKEDKGFLLDTSKLTAGVRFGFR